MKFTKKRQLKIRHLSNKFMLLGKSYKISAKRSVFNMRFNRANRTILVIKHSQLLNKNGQKKLYINNAALSQSKLNKVLGSIRGLDTYTLRGLWSATTIISKRSGRISEYM